MGKVNAYYLNMILCYLAKLFRTIVLTSKDWILISINWIIYYTPDDITCFLSDPFGILLLYVLLIIIIIVSTFVYIFVLDCEWKSEQREYRRRTFRSSRYD